MNVGDSDLLLAALDRRLLVDRVATIDAPLPAARSADAPRPPPPMPMPSASATPETAPDARLPLGRVIAARVVDVPRADRVIADVGDLRIEMTWPAGPAPRAGDDIALRVLAHRPMLLFERVADATAADRPSGDADVDAAPRWSGDALRLQARAEGPDRRAASPTRFDVPIVATGVATPSAPNPTAAPSPRPDAAAITADGVVVARGPSTVDGDVGATRHPNDGTASAPGPFVPLVLQGPAWDGQAVELVVRRERRDEALDDPVLDQWCGEVMIELPILGRVAGHLAFSMRGLRLRLEGDDDRSVAAMTAGAAELAHALAGAELRVSALSVGRPATAVARSDG